MELNKLVRDAYLKTNPGENAKNEEYLSSPYLAKLHEASKEAFETFMDNEKDNKEFCAFIEDLKMKQGRS